MESTSLDETIWCFKMFHSNTKNADSRVRQSQGCVAYTQAIPLPLMKLYISHNPRNVTFLKIVSCTSNTFKHFNVLLITKIPEKTSNTLRRGEVRCVILLRLHMHFFRPDFQICCGIYQNNRHCRELHFIVLLKVVISLKGLDPQFPMSNTDQFPRVLSCNCFELFSHGFMSPRSPWYKLWSKAKNVPRNVAHWMNNQHVHSFVSNYVPLIEASS